MVYEQSRLTVSPKTAGKLLNSARVEQGFSPETSMKIGFVAKNITVRNEHKEVLFV